MNLKISVVIPTYEYGGRAPDLLDQCIGSISNQSILPYEVIVIDHSIDSTVENCLNRWKDLNLVYSKNNRGRGNSSVNMNEGIKIASGDIIKVLHMDDWFCNQKSIEYIFDGIRKYPEIRWGGFGFNHYYESQNVTTRYIRPHINSDIKTLLGCPSVSFFYNDQNFFDEDLIIINDSDMHMRLGKKYGMPLLIDETCVTIRMHDLQVSNNVTSDRHNRELEIYRRKYLNG